MEKILLKYARRVREHDIFMFSISDEYSSLECKYHKEKDIVTITQCDSYFEQAFAEFKNANNLEIFFKTMKNLTVKRTTKDI